MGPLQMAEGACGKFIVEADPVLTGRVGHDDMLVRPLMPVSLKNAIPEKPEISVVAINDIFISRPGMFFKVTPDVNVEHGDILFSTGELLRVDQRIQESGKIDVNLLVELMAAGLQVQIGACH
jgi:hypothetical protein